LKELPIFLDKFLIRTLGSDSLNRKNLILNRYIRILETKPELKGTMSNVCSIGKERKEAKLKKEYMEYLGFILIKQKTTILQLKIELSSVSNILKQWHGVR